MISGLGQDLPPDPMARAAVHSLSPGSVISGVAHSFPPVFVARDMARTLAPGSVVSGVPPRLMTAPGAGGKRQSLFVRPCARNLSKTAPGSGVSGVGLSVSSGFVASSVVTELMTGGLSQSLV